MYNLPTSFLIFFFLFSLIHHLPCDSSQIGWNNTTGQKSCDHQSIRFHCNRNTPSLSISDQEFNVLHINQTSKTLRLVRSHISSFCSSSFTNTTLPPDIFELSPTYKSITVFYDCNPFRHHLTSFTVNVPTSFRSEEKDLIMTNLISVIENGFEVRLKIDENKICGFNEILPFGVTCGPLHPPTGFFSGGIEVAGIVAASGALMAILIAGALFCLIIRRRNTLDDLRQQKKLKAHIPLKHYNYAQVKKMTKSFAEVVGKGGFGTVYRGTLCDGRSVAVKVLKDSKGSNGEDFINEVASISKTSHVNIVDLLGFCSEGSKRAIIYEFLENGSLNQFISRNPSMNMDWMVLYGIALGVARGLEYLHYGCKTRIVHFDIKPQNVLLDGNLCPKVSDFGLAKLCERKGSMMSLLDTRGTIGYIAPEVFSRMYGRVSHKSDVYSYGMLVLEMIGAKNQERADQTSASNASSMYFPEWIYKDLEKRDNETPTENRMSSEDEEIAKKMTMVGLWCIQTSPLDRPAMNRVVEMMEGSVNALEVPPRPVFYIPPAPLQESSTLSENISVYTDYDPSVVT